jgi:hypothetical protein
MLKAASGMVGGITALILGVGGLASALGFDFGGGGSAPQAQGVTPTEFRIVEDARDNVVISGYYTEADQLQHLVVLQRGELTERWFSTYKASGGRRALGPVPPQSAIAALSTPDRVSRVIIAAEDKLTEIHHLEDGPIERRVLATTREVLKMAAYYAPDDKLIHVITASQVEINEHTFTTEGVLAGQRKLATIVGVSGLGAFYGRLSGGRHYVIVMTFASSTPGTVSKELRILDITPTQGSPDTNPVPAAEIPAIPYDKDVERLAAYDSPSDGFDRVIVATSKGELEEMLLVRGRLTGRQVIAEVSRVNSLAGYYADADRLQHLLVSSDDGKIREFWYPGK